MTWTTRLQALESQAPQDSLALGVMHGSLDYTIAAFIIALGAAAYDMQVDMFFTFWGTAALRDPKKKVKKGFIDRMFGWMLPRGTRRLPLSQMQMLGMGPEDDPAGHEDARRRVPRGSHQGRRRVRDPHPRLHDVHGSHGHSRRKN